MRTTAVAIWNPNSMALVAWNKRVSIVASQRKENPSDKQSRDTSPPHGWCILLRECQSSDGRRRWRLRLNPTIKPNRSTPEPARNHLMA